MRDNPYKTPTKTAGRLKSDNGTSATGTEFEIQVPLESLPAVSPAGTTMARHIAAILDNMLAIFVTIATVKQLPEDRQVVQVLTMVVVYLAYYFVFEALLSSTPGKLLTGLKVLSFNGTRCSIKQIVIRTLFRLIEVNPFFLGGLPAAARILWTRDKQRFGDKYAKTIVVFR